MRKNCLEAVYRLAKTDSRVVFIGSDLGEGTLDNFRLEIPDRFFMEGISEAHIVGMAAGLALEGKIVYINTIATFLTRRCYEQVVVDLGMHELPVRLLASGGGLVYAPLGPTHEAIEDIAIMRAIPGMTVIAPADALEMEQLMSQTLEPSGPIYVRIAKGDEACVTAGLEPALIGAARHVRTGDDALLICTGVMLQQCLAAADLLARCGIEAAILHCHTIKPLDEVAVLEACGRVACVVTVEEHSLIGGLGSALAELMLEQDRNPNWRFKRIALPDAFPGHYGSQKQLWEHFGLTPESISATVQTLLGMATVR
jgi:transketolase